MRVISFAAALYFATTTAAVPVPAVHSPLLDNLPDTILDAVSDLLGYPVRPEEDDFRCYWDPGFCMSDCTSDCIAGNENCGTCFQGCYKKHHCFNRHREDKPRGSKNNDNSNNNGASPDDGGI
ncbi:hypothetical protein F5X96DRAFT_669683 [Biscogniauxia mediterranea]|nr:hypothetical protein F5X96DRAFT_669683 [Biscogniauxia mediterranea]